MSREFLVVLDTDQAEQALIGLREVAQVTQMLPPRLALVRGGTGALAAVPGVASVHDSAAGDLPGDLTDSERLFVTAWRSRPGADESKRGSTDGLKWDAPGFEPPDPPGGRSG